MAREIGVSFALNAGLSGGFKAAFQGAAAQVRHVGAAIREMEKSPVGRIGQAMAGQRQKIKGLAGDLREAKGILAALSSQAQASGGATGMLARQIELAEKRVNGLNGALQRQLAQWRNNSAQAATQAGSVSRLAQEYTRLAREVDRAKRAQQGMHAARARADSLRMERSDLNSRLTGVTMAAATVAVPAKLSIDFEQSIANVGAVANASDEDMQRLTETARQLGRDTMFSASQAAEGMKYLAMAGFDADQTIAAMPGMLDLAAAANTDLGRTADIASDIMTAFGLKASDMGEVADTLAKTFTSSNTDLTMLGDTMKYVAPVAASLGMTLQDTAAYAGAMANAGIKASQGGTVLRAAMLRVAAPPRASADVLAKLSGLEGEELEQLQQELGDSAEMLSQLGMTTRDEAGNLRPLVDIIEELNWRTKEMGTAERAEVFKKVFGTEASAGMLALADQAAKTIDDKGNLIVDSVGRQTTALRKMLDTTNNFGGTASDIATEMAATTHGALLRLRSAWEDAGISVGNLFLPAITKASNVLSTVANAISGFVQRFPNLSKWVGLTVAGIITFSAVTLGLGLVFNMVRTSMNMVVGGFWRLAAAQIRATTTTTAATTASGAFGAASTAAGTGARFFASGLRSIMTATGIGAILVGVGFAINLLIEHWDEVVAAMRSAWQWISTTFSKLGVFFSALARNLGEAFSGVWEAISNGASWVVNTVVGIWNGIVEFFNGLVTAIADFFIGLWTGIEESSLALWDSIAGAAEWAVETVSEIWNSILDFFAAIVEGVCDFFVGLWTTIEETALSLWESITSSASWAFEGISAIWNTIVEVFNGIISIVTETFSGLWNGVKDMAQAAFGWVADIWNGAVEFFSGIVDAISGFFSGLFDWLREKFSWVITVLEWIGEAIDLVTGSVSDAYEEAYGEKPEGAPDKSVSSTTTQTPIAPGANTSENAANVANTASTPVSAPELGGAPEAKVGKGGTFTPVARQPEVASAAHGRKAGAGSSGAKRSGGGGSSRSARGGAGGGYAGAGSSGGPVTIVRVGGDNSKTQTLHIPAGSSSGQALQTPLSGNTNESARAGTALASDQMALPQAPELVQQKAARQETRPATINIDLDQHFSLISEDPGAIRKVLESIRPDMEALVRRALANIESNRRRTAYAQ